MGSDSGRRPEEQATLSRELLTNIAAATGSPVTAVVRQLVHEVATADELMIDLVRGAYLRQDPVERAGALEEVLGHVRPGVPVTTAATIAKVWLNRDLCSTSRPARPPVPSSPA